MARSRSGHSRLLEAAGSFLLLLAWTVGLLVVGPLLAVVLVGQ